MFGLSFLQQFSARAIVTAQWGATARRFMSITSGPSGSNTRDGSKSPAANVTKEPTKVSLTESRLNFANKLTNSIANMGTKAIGRSVPVTAGGASKAYARLNRIITDNNVRRELNLRRRYEKPKYKRQRLRYESHARRFKKEVQKKVQLIMKMKDWGI
ncbi:hypothetical protein GGI25_001142 [Coemansia spiralis]|uniref:Ribosomal protein S21 n=2 Tax=Coemansia TaxID=4863 RepID=A0A9W8GDH6_9FUNG|nr:hypothetical protein BX070DRAFT_237668 [Coemansia spiralis]KAJ1995575.1 hypothetical protein EDC05_000813 [Coemansia umbellata]KAJ2625093.1 hypothetical protein GGI26_000896 [Coemansia sp. RSA 1358]KAJ2679953.1 hypothetical protein GGI25_001142 [Coemansia spiralis]